jgi:hypothetical protein
MNLEKLDHPVVFAIAITFVVLGMSAFLAWGFTTLNWTGPLGVVQRGVA